jgi:hypothetical protein
LLVSSNWSALILRFENQHSAFFLLLAARRKREAKGTHSVSVFVSLSLFLSGNSQGLGLTRKSSVLFWFGLVFVNVNVWEEGEGTTVKRTWVLLFLQVLRTSHVLSAFLLHFQKHPKHTRTQKWCFVSFFISLAAMYKNKLADLQMLVYQCSSRSSKKQCIISERWEARQEQQRERERERGACAFVGGWVVLQ